MESVDGGEPRPSARRDRPPALLSEPPPTTCLSPSFWPPGLFHPHCCLGAQPWNSSPHPRSPEASPQPEPSDAGHPAAGWGVAGLKLLCCPCQSPQRPLPAPYHCEDQGSSEFLEECSL